MRYYRMIKDTQLVRVPEIINSHGRIKLHEIGPGNYHLLPDRRLLPIRGTRNIDFVKVIMTPLFLVSEDIKECLQLYEPQMRFKEIILLDGKYKQAMEYFLPALDEAYCLAETSRHSRSRLLYGGIDLDRAGDKSIFYLAGIGQKEIVVRLDVAESMLRRGARGFVLEEIEYR